MEETVRAFKLKKPWSYYFDTTKPFPNYFNPSVTLSREKSYNNGFKWLLNEIFI